jgi:hypothetical protein
MQRFKEIKIKNGLKINQSGSISESNSNFPLIDDKPEPICIGFDDLENDQKMKQK